MGEQNRGLEGQADWRASEPVRPGRMSMLERIQQAQDQRNNETGQKPASMARLAEQSNKREAASLASVIASEKARLIAELSSFSIQDKLKMLTIKDRELSREEVLVKESNRMGGVSPENRAALASYRGSHSAEDWEKSVQARRAALEELKKQYETVQ